MGTVTTVKQVSRGMKALISQAVYEVLNDPDLGMELSVRAKQRLSRARRGRGKGVPLAEIKRRYY